MNSNEKNFSAPLAVAIILLCLGILPGIVVLAIYAPQAKQYPDAPHAKSIIYLNRFVFAAIGVLVLIYAAWFVYGMATF